MICLNYKHFGNKVFLKDLNNKIVNEILVIPRKDKKNNIPNFGVLIRFKNNTVGLSIQWLDRNGHSNYSYESTQHKTISSWAKFHMNNK